MNTVSAPSVLTGIEGDTWGVLVGWRVAQQGPKGSRKDVCGKVRELAPNFLCDLGQVTSLGLSLFHGIGP